LENFYYSTGKIENSLDLYGKAAGRESNNRLRSDIFYKIACINAELGDKKNALRSVDYALSIFPENAKASLLKTKLQ
jgi:tetratricopeptide (TPR) repeat protein